MVSTAEGDGKRMARGKEREKRKHTESSARNEQEEGRDEKGEKQRKMNLM